MRSCTKQALLVVILLCAPLSLSQPAYAAGPVGEGAMPVAQAAAHQGRELAALPLWLRNSGSRAEAPATMSLDDHPILAAMKGLPGLAGGSKSVIRGYGHCDLSQGLCICFYDPDSACAGQYGSCVNQCIPVM